LKKKLPDWIDFKRKCIEREHPGLSVRRQCELLGLNRSSWYYQPTGESAENLQWMRQIDEQYLKTPFYGSRKMAEVLGIDRKRAQRLMRLMGLEAIYPKPHLSRNTTEHRIYPYLLRNVAIVEHARRPVLSAGIGVGGCGHQHGWSRPLDGQRVRGMFVADGEVRAHLPSRSRETMGKTNTYS